MLGIIHPQKQKRTIKLAAKNRQWRQLAGKINELMRKIKSEDLNSSYDKELTLQQVGNVLPNYRENLEKFDNISKEDQLTLLSHIWRDADANYDSNVPYGNGLDQSNSLKKGININVNVENQNNINIALNEQEKMELIEFSRQYEQAKKEGKISQLFKEYGPTLAEILARIAKGLS